MSEQSEGRESEELAAWTRKMLDAAVEEILNLGILQEVIVEARPAWTLPHKIMIGQVRNSGERRNFHWFICGEVPTDYLDSAAATTPREAARHFVMKWQLEAARCQDLSVQESLGMDPTKRWDLIGRNLAEKAEALYTLVDDETIWQQHTGL
jgi:hypothetical protein